MKKEIVVYSVECRGDVEKTEACYFLMADGRDQFLVQRPSRSVQLIRCPPLHCSLGLPLFLFLLNVACSALCGIRSTVIFSTCPNHWSLRWTTLSSKVVWIPNACLISSFLIFYSLW